MANLDLFYRGQCRLPSRQLFPMPLRARFTSAYSFSIENIGEWAKTDSVKLFLRMESKRWLPSTAEDMKKIPLGAALCYKAFLLPPGLYGDYAFAENRADEWMNYTHYTTWVQSEHCPQALRSLLQRSDLWGKDTLWRLRYNPTDNVTTGTYSTQRPR
ncbi:hypothetical protein OE88DRAFT_28876 [Heliocybe sulcata]|uniref:Uncharacterized protein n=1 Tax=Heliocybe sulcata TaxID=5364 RepID=A0A5C3NFL1_9AGAM|nr:hypothetical protein OE88DRAFT_28876 [Heliocybe sulcata]